MSVYLMFNLRNKRSCIRNSASAIILKLFYFLKMSKIISHGKYGICVYKHSCFNISNRCTIMSITHKVKKNDYFRRAALR